MRHLGFPLGEAGVVAVGGGRCSKYEPLHAIFACGLQEVQSATYVHAVVRGGIGNGTLHRSHRGVVQDRVDTPHGFASLVHVGDIENAKVYAVHDVGEVFRLAGGQVIGDGDKIATVDKS